jgi:undecaprenyl-diphosphatase
MELKVAFARIDQAELSICRYVNMTSDFLSVRAFFRLISWLGDGWFWYALMSSLPFVYGSSAWNATAHMAVTGAVTLLLYKSIKSRAVRERPYITHAAIHCVSAPLDRYSFPSGHTMHAVAFAIVMLRYFPEWSSVLVAFASLVALSRVVLGLHYPTDVAAGALLGAAVAFTSLEAAALL